MRVRETQRERGPPTQAPIRGTGPMSEWGPMRGGDPDQGLLARLLWGSQGAISEIGGNFSQLLHPPSEKDGVWLGRKGWRWKVEEEKVRG